jgi:hypothetical protein
MTIVNDIDLSGKGGLVWQKTRGTTGSNTLVDTVRGVNKILRSDTTGAEITSLTDFLTAFNNNGFTIGVDNNLAGSGTTGVSWTFAKQPKFFDVVTYTGTGANRTIAHNLGSVPGCIIVKRTDTTGAWQVYHRSLANTQYMVLNTQAAVATGATRWNSTTPTDTVFSVGTDATVNASGGTYVAYIFAHDSGGFGLTGTDNVISCGSYTGNGVVAGPSITLGYEPQWVLVKGSTVAGSNWFLMDNMRGMAYTLCNELYADLTAAEVAQSKTIIPTATGFNVATNDAYINNSGSTYIYIAIRRGPMKVPTDATKVFKPVAYTGTGNYDFTPTIGNFVVDMVRVSKRTASETYNGTVSDRLKGARSTLFTPRTQAEATALDWVVQWDKQNSVGFGTDAAVNESGASQILHAFSRAPSFFDEVCYTGTGTTTTQTHNLGVPPELVICKSRSSATYPDWGVWSAGNGVVNNDISGLSLNLSAAAAYINLGYSSRFTATTFRPDTVYDSTENSKNQSGQTYVAYLFATCPGVSKVGSYTGTGTTQTINCGFTGGARFVLIKRTDSTGDWRVVDTARGMVAGTDPYLSLNTTAAEVNANNVYTTASGFQLVSSDANFNANSGSYIFLAVA